ncbi:sulfite exporter TauE/SafE family protein [Candidatus Neomarinimicrobiota bacterium]
MDLDIIFHIAALAFICELVDSTLGMGYGTILTPLLLLMGYEPLDIVPAVLLSECISGVTAGFAHHEFGNLNLKPGTRDFRVAALLAGLSVGGILIAVVIAVSIPAWAVKLYIGILVLGLGVFILWNRNRTIPFTWMRISGLGALASFNKGISGGGYGPVVTGGLVLSGVSSRSAIGITSLAEGVCSAVGVIAYLASTATISWQLAPSLLLGAILSVPLAAYTVSKVPTNRLTLCIGGLCMVLGGYTLLRLAL